MSQRVWGEVITSKSISSFEVEFRMAREPVRPIKRMVGKNLRKVRKGLIEETFSVYIFFCLGEDEEDTVCFLS